MTGTNRSPDPPAASLAFAALLSDELSTAAPRKLGPGECRTAGGTTCTLCWAHRVDYKTELVAKQRAFDRFWHQHGFSARPEPIVPAPAPRFYRTVSKRRVFRTKRGFRLGLIGVDEDSAGRFPVAVDQCVIEPESHRKVYAAAEAFIAEHRHSDVAEILTYVIVKGDAANVFVIFNIAGASRTLRKGLTALSHAVTGAGDFVHGVYLFVDPERSSYYLSSRGAGRGARRDPLHGLRLFGKPKLEHAVGGLRFRYGPLSFSQTNHAILEPFIAGARRLLAPSLEADLLDCYSGYGLFALSLAAGYRSVTAVELSADAVEDGRANAERLRIANCRFVRNDISDSSLPAIIRSFRTVPQVILDPPRNGPKPGVIEALAAARVERAVHIFCNVERLAEDTARWTKGGYSMRHALPFDMFPGTNELELMVEFAPQRV